MIPLGHGEQISKRHDRTEIQKSSYKGQYRAFGDLKFKKVHFFHLDWILGLVNEFFGNLPAAGQRVRKNGS
jgi:hypothetical protein